MIALLGLLAAWYATGALVAVVVLWRSWLKGEDVTVGDLGRAALVSLLGPCLAIVAVWIWWLGPLLYRALRDDRVLLRGSRSRSEEQGND